MIDARLVKLDDGTWYDIVQWESRDAAEAAAAQFAEIPECSAIQATIDEMLSFHHGVEAEPEASHA